MKYLLTIIAACLIGLVGMFINRWYWREFILPSPPPKSYLEQNFKAFAASEFKYGELFSKRAAANTNWQEALVERVVSISAIEHAKMITAVLQATNEIRFE